MDVPRRRRRRRAAKSHAFLRARFEGRGRMPEPSIKKSHRREPRDDGFRENELGSFSVSSISAITSDSEDQRVLLAVVLLLAMSTRLGALSLPNALWGCVPMIVTLRKDVASAMPAHAADALVDLMSILKPQNAVCSRRQYSWHPSASDAVVTLLLLTRFVDAGHNAFRSFRCFLGRS
jgi:hypothetical protein